MGLSDYAYANPDSPYGSGSGGGLSPLLAPPPAPAQRPPPPPPPAALAQPPAPGTVRGVSYPTEAAQPPAPLGGVSLAALPGGQAVPAGFDPSTRSTTSKQAMQYSPDTLGAIGASGDARAELIRAQDQAKGAHDVTDAQLAHKLLLQDDANALAHKQAAVTAKSEAGAYYAKIEKLMAGAASDREDPMKWFKDQTTGGQAMTALGLAIAGFGHGYTGGGMDPMAYINGQIKASTEAQRQAHLHKQENIEGKLTGYQFLKSQFGDDEKASLASDLLQRQSIIGHAQEAAADQTAPADNRLRAAQIAAQLTEDQEKRRRDLDEKQATSVESSFSDKYRQATAGGAGPVGVRVPLADGSSRVITIAQAKEAGMMPKDALEARKTTAETAKTEAEVAKLKGEGVEDSDAQLREALGGVQNPKTGAFEGGVKSVAGNPLSNIPGTDAYEQDEANEAANLAITAAYRKKNQGRLTEKQQERLEEQLIHARDIQSVVDSKKKRWLSTLGKGGSASVSPGEGAEPE